MDKLRLAFIFQLTKYITWPESSFNNETSRIRVCIVGPDTKQLQALHRDKVKQIHSQGRNLELIAYNSWHSLKTLKKEENCHLVYLGYLNPPPIELVSIVENNNGLLIGKDLSFVDAGGMMALTKNGAKLSIILKQEWVNTSQVKIQARFLRIIKLR